ncbi:MAG: hypothetical protein ACM3ON_13800 [Chloroflexota bacterium]
MERFLKRLEQIYGAIDSFYAAAQNHYRFSCSGCTDSCCATKFSHHTLIEEHYLAQGLLALDEAERDEVLARAEHVVGVYALSPDDVRIICPLNVEGLCTLYQYRPMICRMHGVPYEVARADGSVEFGGGCHRFMSEKAHDGTHYFMFSRTMFYSEMARLEGDVRVRLAFQGRVDKNVAQMIVDALGGRASYL